MKCIKRDLALLGNDTQMCLGQKCGIEHAIHALRKGYESPGVEGILLIDAQNAFNSLNRELALKNIDKLCPSLSQAIGNSYSTPSDLYINSSTVKSQKGTTQGDPLAMAMYGIAILPLIKRVLSDNVTQKWYADDGNAAGSIPLLSKLYHDLKEIGPHFGYKVIKCHLTKWSHKTRLRTESKRFICKRGRGSNKWP